MNKLLSIFWEPEPEVQTPAATGKVNLQQAPTNPGAAPAALNFPPATSGGVAQSTALTGVVDDAFAQHFNTVLDEKKIPGNAYSLFNKQLTALDSLKAAGVTEDNRYKAALATLTTTNPTVTKKSILSAAAKYLELLNQDDKDANTLVEQRKTEEIGKRQQDILDLQAENQKKLEQKAQLDKEIQDNNTAIGIKQGEIITKGNEIEQRNQNFKATWNVYYTNLQTSIANITSFLLDDAPKQ